MLSYRFSSHADVLIKQGTAHAVCPVRATQPLDLGCVRIRDWAITGNEEQHVRFSCRPERAELLPVDIADLNGRRGAMKEKAEAYSKRPANQSLLDSHVANCRWSRYPCQGDNTCRNHPICCRGLW